MARGATFTGVWARCPQHSLRLLEPNEEMCFECRLVERNLALTPPFDVYCTETTYEAEKDMVYTVIWVITSGRDEYWAIKGYCFEAEDGSVIPHVYDSLKFIPVQYMTDDHKDSWVKYD